MSKTGLIVLSLLAAFAMSAASAEAATHAYFIEGSEIAAKEKVEVQFTSSTSELESTIAGIKATIECEESGSIGNLEEKGKSSGTFKLSTCRPIDTSNKGVEEFPSNCTVKEPIEYKFNDELIGAVEDEIKPEKELFGIITLEGEKCILSGKYELKGTGTCELSDGEDLRIDHELACTATGDKLKLGTEPARFAGTFTVKLASSKEWYTN
jgi:hypothetical protein